MVILRIVTRRIDSKERDAIRIRRIRTTKTMRYRNKGRNWVVENVV